MSSQPSQIPIMLHVYNELLELAVGDPRIYMAEDCPGYLTSLSANKLGISLTDLRRPVSGILHLVPQPVGTEMQDIDIPLFKVPVHNIYIPEWMAVIDTPNYAVIVIPVTPDAPPLNSLMLINEETVSRAEAGEQPMLEKHHLIYISQPGRKPPPNSKQDNFSLLAA